MEGQSNQPADAGGINNDGGRMAVEIRGEDLVEARVLRRTCRFLLQTTPPASPIRGSVEKKLDGSWTFSRPAEGSTLGLTHVVDQTIRTNVAGTTAAQFRQGGYDIPSSSGCVLRIGTVADVNDVMVNTGGGRLLLSRT